MNFLKNARAVVAAVVVGAVGSANAAISTTEVTTALTDAGAALAVVGAAYVAMRYGASVWKWLTKFSS